MTAMEFPLIEHELGRLGRRKSTYAIRVVPVGVAVFALLLNLMMVAAMRSAGVGSAGPFNDSFDFEIVAGVQVGIVMLFTPILSAMAIAREKQDRTLGLLTLAERRSYDVYFSKLASIVIAVSSLVMCILPLSILNVVLAGVSWSAFVLEYVHLFIGVVLVASVGLLCSAYSSRAVDAVILTYGVLFGAFFFVPDVLVPSADVLRESALGMAAIAFALSIVVASALVLGFAFWTVRLLNKNEESATARTRRLRRARTSVEGQAGVAAIYDGAACNQGSAWLSPPRRWMTLVIAALAGYAMQRYLSFTLHWPLLFVLVYDIIATMEGLGRQGTLDVLGCTTATDRSFARAIVRVHFKRGLVLFPALAIGTVLSLFSPMAMMNLSFQTPRDGAIAITVIVTSVLANLVALYLIAAIGTFVVAGPGGTAKRLAFSVLHYVFVNMIVSIGTMAIVFIPLASMDMLSFSAATPFPPLLTIGTGVVSAVFSYLFAVSYRNRLSTRIGKQWRNGGVDRVVLNPVSA